METRFQPAPHAPQDARKSSAFNCSLRPSQRLREERGKATRGRSARSIQHKWKCIGAFRTTHGNLNLRKWTRYEQVRFRSSFPAKVAGRVILARGPDVRL